MSSAFYETKGKLKGTPDEQAEMIRLHNADYLMKNSPWKDAELQLPSAAG